MNEKKYIEINFDNESKIKYEILEVFYLFETKKNYVICTDNSYNKSKLNIYAFIYNDKAKNIEKINSDYEWAIIENKIKKYKGV